MTSHILQIAKLRKLEPRVLSIGSHPGIIQSMLDYDYLNGKQPGVVGIVAAGRKYERYFWGEDEVLVKVYESLEVIPESVKKEINLFLNVSSGRRTHSSTLPLLAELPNLITGNLFAEEVPEKDSLEIFQVFSQQRKTVIGPASVGLLVPGSFKLGAIGGVEARQLLEANLFTPGEVAVFSASGGMTNEIINIVAKSGQNLSFALSFGGDRFPTLSPVEALKIAEADPQTKAVVYYGELGGYDEYEIVELIKSGRFTKPLVVYIAGVVSQMFATPPQFGHAKAMAGKGEETAQAKRDALKKVGAKVAGSFNDFIKLIAALKTKPGKGDPQKAQTSEKLDKLQKRRAKYLISRVCGEVDGDVQILGKGLEELALDFSYAELFASMLLGKKVKSRELIKFTDLVLKLAVDHGPYVSGAVSTMITARAGKDLVSSLAAGLLTIGPRFGGAINEAAGNWLSAVMATTEPYEFVERFAAQRKFIAGIGHRKYRSDNPDPRVQLVLSVAKPGRFAAYAKEIEAVTITKKANLILNLDGAIAAVLLDILHTYEGLSLEELKELVDVEFFNAYFVLPRALGFTAHFLDQKRLDEGLFRLGPNEIGYLND